MSNSLDTMADSIAGLTVAMSQNNQNSNHEQQEQHQQQQEEQPPPNDNTFEGHVRRICDRMNPADHDRDTVLHAAKTLCSLLDNDGSRRGGEEEEEATPDPFQPLLKCGGLERLAMLLRAPDPTVVEVAAECFTKMTTITHQRLLTVRDLLPNIEGTLTQLVSLLEAPGQRTRLHVAKTLTDFATEGAQYRDFIINSGVVPPLRRAVQSAADAESQDAVKHGRPASDVFLQLVRLVANVCRNKPSPNFEAIEPLVPLVVNLLHYPDPNVQDEACWAISYLNDGPPSRITAVANYGPTPTVLNLLRTGRDTVLLPALRFFGNFTATNPEMTQQIIDAGVLPVIQSLSLLDARQSRQVRKETLFVISNAAAGYDNQVLAVREAGLFPGVVRQIHAPEFEVRREAVWVIANATATADIDRIRYLTEDCHVLDGLCEVLKTMDSRICNIALESLEALLVGGDTFRPQNNGRNPYADRVKEIGGVDNIAKLRDHICHTVFVRSVTLMDRYFEDTWGGGQEGAEFDDDNNDDDEQRGVPLPQD